MGFPVAPNSGDRYTAPSGAVYEYTPYGAWRVAEGQTDFDVLTPDDISDLTTALGTSPTAILDKIKTVDGSTSGLDADLFDGQDSGYYTNIAARLGYTPFNAAHLPATTKMLFMQAAAPTGWTKDTTHNNKALRIVSGTGGVAGGTTAFSTVFTARTIAQANLPNVQLAVTGTAESAGSHTHPYDDNSTIGPNGTTGSGQLSDTRSDTARTTGPGGVHTHVVSGQTAALGSGTAMDFAVQYVDAIICTKS